MGAVLGMPWTCHGRANIYKVNTDSRLSLPHTEALLNMTVGRQGIVHISLSLAVAPFNRTGRLNRAIGLCAVFLTSSFDSDSGAPVNLDAAI